MQEVLWSFVKTLRQAARFWSRVYTLSKYRPVGLQISAGVGLLFKHDID